ncbi:MAG: hypothetical protein ABSC06_31070 [Rhodopila sp.]|jgi:hypothetical protein
MSKHCPENTGVDPREVISPRRNFQLLAVLHEQEDWSMGLGRWRNEDNGTWRTVLVQRWNGWQGSKGNPSARGFACWFVLPDETTALYLGDQKAAQDLLSRIIPDNLRDYVRNELGKGPITDQDAGAA